MAMDLLEMMTPRTIKTRPTGTKRRKRSAVVPEDFPRVYICENKGGASGTQISISLNRQAMEAIGNPTKVQVVHSPGLARGIVVMAAEKGLSLRESPKGYFETRTVELHKSLVTDPMGLKWQMWVRVFTDPETKRLYLPEALED